MYQDASLLDRLREFDENRPSLPGEHWLAFGVGLYFLLSRRRSVAERLASMVVGAAFIARAVTGRDGAIAVLNRPEPASANERW